MNRKAFEMTREQKISEALARVKHAQSVHGCIPEGAAYFLSLHIELAKAAATILLFPHLTEKAKL